MVEVFRPIKDDGAPLKTIWACRIGQVARAKFLRDYRRFHDRAVKQIAFQVDKASGIYHWRCDLLDHIGIGAAALLAILSKGFAVGCHGIRVRQQPCGKQFANHSRHASGSVIIFAKIFTRRLQVDQKRHVMAQVLPIIIVQGHAEVFGDPIEVDRRIGRAANSGIDHNGIFKGFAGHDAIRSQIVMHHIDNP